MLETPGHEPSFSLVKLLDQPNLTTQRVNVFELAIPIEPLQVVAFDALLFFSTLAANIGLGLAVDGPTLPVFTRFDIRIATGGNTYVSAVKSAYEDEFLSTNSQGATPLVATIRGVIENGPIQGFIVPRFRSETQGSLVTILRGSKVNVFRKAGIL